MCPAVFQPPGELSSAHKKVGREYSPRYTISWPPFVRSSAETVPTLMESRTVPAGRSAPAVYVRCVMF
eukprot:3317546-Prymnesium_polylepis.2